MSPYSLTYKRSVHIVGHDWGAVVASAIAVQAPSRVLSLSMLAVPHAFLNAVIASPRQVLSSWYMLFFQVPIFPIAWLANFNGSSWLWSVWSPDLSK